MPRIYDLIEKNKIKKILQQYFQQFKSAIFILDRDGNILLCFPECNPESELMKQPIHVRDSLVGYIAMPEGGHVTESLLDFVRQNFSDMCEMGYEIESLSSEVAKNYEELSLLWRLSSRLGAGLHVETICDVLANEVMSLCPSSNVSILLVSEPGEETGVPLTKSGEDLVVGPGRKKIFLPKVSLGADADSACAMIFGADRGLFGRVFESREPITVCGVSEDKRFEGLPYPVTRILIVPLTTEGSVIGAILATDKLDGREYYSTEIKLIHSIASECAISIKKALLFEEIRGMLFSVTESFALAIDAKDPYTYGHSKRVSEITAAIAREMGFTPDTISWIKLAALLHDVGKIGTPEEILHKDDTLNEAEMSMVREHPLIGAKMIRHIQRLKDVAQWIYCHHERYDGKGYPSGLKGDEIPVPSKMITIADYFDALTTDRPYRKALSNKEALRIMRELVGTYFDPLLFNSFEKTAT